MLDQRQEIAAWATLLTLGYLVLTGRAGPVTWPIALVVTMCLAVLVATHPYGELRLGVLEAGGKSKRERLDEEDVAEETVERLQSELDLPDEPPT